MTSIATRVVSAAADYTLPPTDNENCDRFEVIAPGGGVLGVRQLKHPHADEQPFTRELHGVKIPRGIVRGVLARAHHSIRGYDGAVLKVRLPD